MISRIGLIGLLAMAAVHGAQAAVTVQEAEALKGALTPMGAERAGNKEGTIPAWTGGLTKAPPGFKPGDPRPAIHPEDKLQFSIDAKTMGAYKDKLSPNLMALMAKHPNFRIDVYPTRRTVGFSQWSYDQTFLNATRTITTNDGLTVENAFGGTPFPIPKTGREVIWNAQMRITVPEMETVARNWVVMASGEKVMLSELSMRVAYPMYDQTNSLEGYQKGPGFFSLTRTEFTGPAVKNGEMMLIRYPIDTYTNKNDVWQYLAGQRRLRKAPNLAYDAPNSYTSGMTNMDESYGVSGALDRFDVKLLGKKEMFIPYNNNNIALAKTETILTPNVPNPDVVRWELHRVWVVEMTVKPGQRNTVPHRVVYIDEDSWNFAMVDSFSADEKPWKVTYFTQYVCPDGPMTGFAGYFSINLQNGVYLMEGDISGSPKPLNWLPKSPASYYTPDALAAAGTR
ncbi:DUF1329 domain-containing protein [Azospirillum agricola]|uniref:DUF1329 domain-containing protein n=1 Tax=Azospirillum agricola TaxID=1720247 RepID=UPI000A0F1840|nr:DUF1329 domain-containing protein [Azospirillum agricola]SMH37293.1 Protein of unknown function [Azospirillum lipoferum]